jgi:hypothetical protein
MHKKESALPGRELPATHLSVQPLAAIAPTQIRQLEKGPAHDPNETAIGVMRWEGAA